MSTQRSAAAEFGWQHTYCKVVDDEPGVKVRSILESWNLRVAGSWDGASRNQQWVWRIGSMLTLLLLLGDEMDSDGCAMT